MVCKFFELTRRELQKRLDMILAGLMPVVMMLREFWYFCRNKFLKENLDLDAIDSTAKKPYENWGGTILPTWLLDHATGPLGIDLQYPPGVTYEKSMHINDKKDCEWWKIRTALNLFAKPTAQCIGADRPFLIDRNTRKYVTKGRSLILICEKTTVIDKLLARLKEKGYHINVIGTGGCSPSEVLEAVIEVAAEMVDKRTNFWVLHLHDYDVSGLEIYFKLKQWGGECVIDVGVNREFVDYLKAHKKLDMRFIEEQVLITSYKEKLRRWIAQGDSVYSEEDFNYLQGDPFEVVDKKGKKERNKKGEVKIHYRAKRIEIDLVEIEYGIDVVIDFILETIADKCRVWDLRRIGVSEEDFGLSNPDCRFTERMDEYKEPDYEKTEDIIDVYDAPEEFGKKVENLWGDLEPLLVVPLDRAKEKILELVDRVYWDVEDAVIAQEVYEEFQPVLDEYTELVKISKEVMEQASTLQGEAVGEVSALEESMKAGLSDLKKQVEDDASALRVEYEDDFDIDWTEAHDEEHQAILGQVEYYEGDVRLGAEDLKEQTEKLQKRIDEASEQYPNFDEFNDKLEGLEQSHSEDQELINTEIRERLEEIDSKLDGFSLEEERIDAFQGLDDRRILELMVEALQQRLEEIDDE